MAFVSSVAAVVLLIVPASVSVTMPVGFISRGFRAGFRLGRLEAKFPSGFTVGLVVIGFRVWSGGTGAGFRGRIVIAIAW